MCCDSNIYPTAVTVTLINNSSSIYTQWHKNLQVIAAVTFTNSRGDRFLVSKLCRSHAEFNGKKTSSVVLLTSMETAMILWTNSVVHKGVHYFMKWIRPDWTKFTHYSPERTGRIRYHVSCSIVSHCSGNSGNTFSLTTYSDYITKSLHNTHTTAKNSIRCQYIVTWVRLLTETCGKSVWELYCVEQVLPGVTCHHQATVSKLWYGLS